MSYIFETVTGSVGALSFKFNGQFALKNYNVEIVNGNRLKVVSTANESFSLLEADVSEVEINGTVYSDPAAAQLALTSLVYSDAEPVVLTKEKYMELAAAVQAADRGKINPATPIPSGGWLKGWYRPEVSSESPGTNYPNSGNLKARSGFDSRFFYDGTNWTRIEVSLPQPVNNITNNITNVTQNVDPSQIVPTEALYNDTGETLASDIRKRVDSNAGVDVNYRKTTEWIDGSAMTDGKVDGIIYLKKGSDYVRRQFEGLPRSSWFVNNIAKAFTLYKKVLIDSVVTLSSDLVLPENSTIEFENIGRLKGGKIIGNKTFISCGNQRIFENVEIEGDFTNISINPTWFGAVPYSRSVITGFLRNEIQAGLVDSKEALQKAFNCMNTTNIRRLEFQNLFYSTDEIHFVPAWDWAEGGYSIVGHGADTGIIAEFNNSNKYALRINDTGSASDFSQLCNYCNFAIYLATTSPSSSNKYAGGIYLNSTIRTDASYLSIIGGFNDISQGLFTLHSVVNNNIFENSFYKCTFVNTNKGNGVHYKHETYQPTLQTIKNCICQQLGGVGIAADMLPITAGTFGGTIINNELEGNAKGCIAIGATGNLTFAHNYNEMYSYAGSTNFFEGIPFAPYTFGVYENNGTGNYRTNIIGLEFVDNKNGSANGSIDDVIIISGNLPSSVKNVRIESNTLSSTNNVKRITSINGGIRISIKNNTILTDGTVHTYTGIPLGFGGNQSSTVYYEDDKIRADASAYTLYAYDKFKMVFYSKNFLKVNNYPFPTPMNTALTFEFKEGEEVLISDLGGVFRAEKGGLLHYDTGVSFTSGSDQITVSGAVWNWEVGQTVKSEFIDTGEATITAKSGSTFTLSKNAIKSGNSWLTDAKLIPTFINFKNSGLFSEKPTVLKNDIKIGQKFFATDKQTPEGAVPGIEIIHKGNDVWVDALGRVVN